MSPHPEITPPPKAPLHLPRQDDYGLSSLYAELSSLYPDLYSSYQYSYSYDSLYYESLLSEYSALASLYSYSYSIPDYYSSYLASVTGGPSATRGGSQATSTSGLEVTSGGDENSGGLSTGAKIGIGVGVPLAVAVLVGIGIFLWCAGKNKGKKNSTTVIAPGQPNAGLTAQPYQQQTQVQPAQMGYVNNQGYMQGYQQQGMPVVTPPPHYVQPQGPPPPGVGYAPYGGYAKGPEPGVVEMEQEYHFARPGVVEMGDGMHEPEQPGKKDGKK